MVWSYAANYSEHEWHVYSERGNVLGKLTREGLPQKGERPNFSARTLGMSGALSFARVRDGWLIGFNQGEFGAALYWFSPDGKRKYKVSDHQIVDFFSFADGIYAIEGLAHLGMSDGSVIRIAKPEPKARWRAETVTKLPFAPYATSVCRDGAILITLSDSIVRVGPDHKPATLLSDPPWSGLYPNSSVLSPDEQKLYIGMRQFVGEFDLRTRKLRLLIPSAQFLHKLPKQDEQRIRETYGD
jgi:hypothetical protein